MIYLFLFFFLPFAYSSEVAVTIDDFNFDQTDYLSPDKRDDLIRSALKKHDVKAMGFVTTKFLSNELAYKAIKEWEKEGHSIGNHTESHLNYHQTDLSTFKNDILIADKKLSGLKNYDRWFRFPYLKEGETKEKRDQLRTFLKEKGFKNGAVTIDASDWYVNQRLLKAYKEGKKIELSKYREFYLNHLWERSLYYHQLGKKAWGKEIKFTLLLHHNVTTALFLDDLMRMYKEKGWKVINANEAFNDPIYKKEINNIPAGESLVWALAKSQGDKILRYPAESDAYEKDKMDQLDL